MLTILLITGVFSQSIEMTYREESESGHKREISARFPYINSENFSQVNELLLKLMYPQEFAQKGYEACLDHKEQRQYFELIPVYIGSVYPGQVPLTMPNQCYKKNQFWLTEEGDTYTLYSISEESRSYFCTDSYLFSIIGQYHTETFFFSGSNIVKFNNITQAERVYVNEFGVKMFTFCKNVELLIADTIAMAPMFFGGFTGVSWLPIIGTHVPEYMQDANLEFLNNTMQLTFRESEGSSFIDFKKIYSGDMLGMHRLDGVNSFVIYTTGSRLGHTAMALWEEVRGKRTLFVVESQDGVHWPKRGVQKTEFWQWMSYAEQADYAVIHLPLVDELRRRFDEKKAWEAFYRLQGYPYGYHTFFFTGIDTQRNNLPPILQPEFFDTLLTVIEGKYNQTFTSMIGEALNNRLGTKDLNLSQIFLKAKERFITLPQLMAMPELDEYMYSDGPSYICSALVAELYRTAGIINKEFNVKEVTPKDLYVLNIFNNTKQNCGPVNSNLPYCQILGRYQIELGESYGTIPPYYHMGDACPTLQPNFERPPFCQ